MRILPPLTAIAALTAAPVLADGHYAGLISDHGIDGTINALETIAAPSASDAFALGGLQALAAVEEALQIRYRYALVDNGSGFFGEVPFLRLSVPDNPAPVAFDPHSIAMIFEQALPRLEQSRAALDRITDDDAVDVTLPPAAIWFDIDDNGTRDPREGLFDVLGGLFGPVPPETETISIRFDTADAAWLSAYTHVLSGAAEVILSTDPTSAITGVVEGASTLDAVRGAKPTSGGWINAGDLDMIDSLTALLVTLEGPMDSTRTRRAHQHFLDALDDNRAFWARLSAETDDNREWIPNAGQSAALPIIFPEGIDMAWQAVLDDAEAVLTGDLLLPHWRLGDHAGLNLAAIFQDPPAIDLIGFFQGYALAPYAQRGPVISNQSLRAFDEITGGQSPFFAVMLN